MKEGKYPISAEQRKKVNALAWHLREAKYVSWDYDKVPPMDAHDDVFSVLDKLTPKDKSARLMLQTPSGLNHTSFFFWQIGDAVVDYTRIDDDKIFDNIIVPNTVIGIWQAFVLSVIWCAKLPLFDHSNYERITLILSEKDMPVIDNNGREFYSAPKGTDVSFKDKYLPYIEVCDNGVTNLYFHFFNDWMGFVKCHHRITISKDGKIDFGHAKTKVVIPYNCGICF